MSRGVMNLDGVKVFACDGKHRFPSISTARQALRHLEGRRATIYRCTLCRSFHIASNNFHRGNVRRLKR